MQKEYIAQLEESILGLSLLLKEASSLSPFVEVVLESVVSSLKDLKNKMEANK